MRVFVTGSTGFIGRHLVAKLKADGHLVSEYGGRGDSLCDPLRMFERIRQAEPEVVYHLAAHAAVRMSARDSALVFESNTRGTFNLLEAMREAGPQYRRIVFASSCSVYGEPTTFPSGEYTSAMPVQTSLYGASKLAGEALCQAYDSTYGFKSSIMRLVSQLGPGQTRGHIPDLFAKLVQDPTKLVVMGNGEQQRSYMHVADCVSALTRVGLTPHLGVFNVSNGRPWTVLESIECLRQELNIDPEVILGEEGRGWVGDSPHIEPDTTRLLSTGWVPQYTTREAAVETIRDLMARQGETA